MINSIDEIIYPQTTPARNIYNNTLSGGSASGYDFIQQRKHKTVKSIQVTWNSNYISNIQVQFNAKASSVRKEINSKPKLPFNINPFDILNQNEDDIEENTNEQQNSNQEAFNTQTHSFEFQAGEQLIGDILICPNIYLESNKNEFSYNNQYYSRPLEKSVAYIRFQTSFGRTFEAGNIIHLSQDARYVFDADQTFMTGLFGITNSTSLADTDSDPDPDSDKVVSLGFILTHKIQDTYFDNLEWDEHIQVKQRVNTGQSRFYCNNKDGQRQFKVPYQFLRGVQRCSWTAHPFLDMSQVKFKSHIVMPKVSMQGRVKFEPVWQALGTIQHEGGIETIEEIKFDSEQDFNIENVNSTMKIPKKSFQQDNRSLRQSSAVHELNIEKGKCARIGYKQTIAKYDNAKYTFTYNFMINEYYIISFLIEGYTSYEKQISNKIETEYKDQFDIRYDYKKQTKDKPECDSDKSTSSKERDRRDSEASTLDDQFIVPEGLNEQSKNDDLRFN